MYNNPNIPKYYSVSFCISIKNFIDSPVSQSSLARFLTLVKSVVHITEHVVLINTPQIPTKPKHLSHWVFWYQQEKYTVPRWGNLFPNWVVFLGKSSFFLFIIMLEVLFFMWQNVEYLRVHLSSKKKNICQPQV